MESQTAELAIQKVELEVDKSAVKSYPIPPGGDGVNTEVSFALSGKPSAMNLVQAPSQFGTSVRYAGEDRYDITVSLDLLDAPAFRQELKEWLQNALDNGCKIQEIGIEYVRRMSRYHVFRVAVFN